MTDPRKIKDINAIVLIEDTILIDDDDCEDMFFAYLMIRLDTDQELFYRRKEKIATGNTREETIMNVRLQGYRAPILAHLGPSPEKFAFFPIPLTIPEKHIWKYFSVVDSGEHIR